MAGRICCFPVGLLIFLIHSAGSLHAQNCTNAAATPSVCAFDTVKNAAAKTKIKGVLLYDWTAGNHEKTYAQAHMMRLAQKYGFRLDRSSNQNYITAATLQGIDLIVFNNSDSDPLQNSTSLQAVRNFVEVQGKAILILHAGADYIRCPGENLADSACRWMMRCVRTGFWISNSDQTRGTIFADSVVSGEIPPRATGISAVPATRNHGRKHPETANIFENLPTNGGTGPLANRPYIWEGVGDEWYNYRNNPRLQGELTIENIKYGPINILLSLDENSIADDARCNDGSNCKNKGTFGDRPVSWTRKVGNGLAAYQSAGHSNVYTRARKVGGIDVNDSLIEKYNWRLMKYLARDFVGCMDPSSPAYNPEATVSQLHPGFDESGPCGTTGTRDARKPLFPVQFSGAGTSLRVTLPDGLQYRIQASDARGRMVYSRLVQGPGVVASPPLHSGLYVIQARSAEGEQTGMVEIRPQ